MRRYYDDNTRRFLRLGHGGKAFAIHRAVWAQNIRSREGAIHHVDDCILKEIREIRAEWILDLGCGVGGSMVYLAHRWEADFRGITLSPVQSRLGQKHIGEEGLAVRCRILRGDFLDPETLDRCRPKSPGPKAAFAIGSFIHARDSALFFRRMSGFLDPGDLLIICDDLLTDEGRSLLSDSGSTFGARRRARKRRGRWLEEHRRGWYALNRITPMELQAMAEKFGFRSRETRDLTPFLELRRPRDRLIGLAVALGRHLPIRGSAWDNLLGGNALQRCLTSGLMMYAYVCLEKSATSVTAG